MSDITAEQRQRARQILIEVARTVDRRLDIEVRDEPGKPRLQVKLSHGSRRGQIELAPETVFAAEDDSVARHDLKLRLKRANDAMLFRPMPNHRISVKPVPPPGGALRRGQGRR